MNKYLLPKYRGVSNHGLLPNMVFKTILTSTSITSASLESNLRPPKYSGNLRLDGISHSNSNTRLIKNCFIFMSGFE